MITLYAGNNSHLLRVALLRDQDGTAVPDGSVTAVFHESDGTTEVGGVSWPATLVHVSDGTYELEILGSAAIVPGGVYVITVTAQKGSTTAEWSGAVTAQRRKLND